MAAKVMKQVISVIDQATTLCCLDAAGQIRPVAQPFDTLQGTFDVPPFHIHCRSVAIPYVRGMVTDQRKAANKELVKRPLKMRDKRRYQSIPGPATPTRTLPTPPTVTVPKTGPLTAEQAEQVGKDLAAQVEFTVPLTDAAKEKVRDTFAKIGARFPRAAPRLIHPMVAPTSRTTAWADYTDGLFRLRVNPELLNTPWPQMQAWFEREVANGHWAQVPSDTDYLFNTVAHEFGHHMHYLIEHHLPTSTAGEMWGDIDLQIHKLVQVNSPGYASMLPQMTLDEKIERFGSHIVSGYGGTSRYEFIAELVAEYVSSPNPSDMARIVGGYMDAAFGPAATLQMRG